MSSSRILTTTGPFDPVFAPFILRLPLNGCAGHGSQTDTSARHRITCVFTSVWSDRADLMVYLDEVAGGVVLVADSDEWAVY
jgi:hypothetical protein